MRQEVRPALGVLRGRRILLLVVLGLPCAAGRGLRQRPPAAAASRRRAFSSRAAAVASDGHTRSIAALTAAPTSTANAETPIHSSTATGAASDP